MTGVSQFCDGMGCARPDGGAKPPCGPFRISGPGDGMSGMVFAKNPLNIANRSPMKYFLLGTSLVLGAGLLVHPAAGDGPDAGSGIATKSGTPETGAADRIESRCDRRRSGFITKSKVSVQRLIGVRVTNPLYEEIGEVYDLILDKCGRVASVVVRVGGFMGVGGRYVRISPDQVRIRLLERTWGLLITVRETRERLLSGRDSGSGDRTDD